MMEARLTNHSFRVRIWQDIRQFLVPTLNYKEWTIVLLMALWLYLNVFDLLITYQGLADGLAYEANRFFSKIIHLPVLAVTIKMSLAYVVLKLVQRVEDRTSYSGLVPLLLINIYLSWVCLHNLHIVNGHVDGAHFLRYYPLLGLPQ